MVACCRFAHIFVGLDVAIVLSVIGAIVGEFRRRNGRSRISHPAERTSTRHGRHIRHSDSSFRWIGVCADGLIGIAQRRIVFEMGHGG